MGNNRTDFLEQRKGKREAFQEMAIGQMTATYNIMLGMARHLKFKPSDMVKWSHEYIKNDNYAKEIAIEEQKWIEEKKTEQLSLDDKGMWGRIRKWVNNR